MSLSSILGTIAGKVSGFITKDVEPAILALLGEIEHDVVAQIIPLAATAITEAGVSIAANPTQSVSGDLDTILAVAKATLPKIEQATITATANDVLTAAAAAVNSAKAAAVPPAPAA